MQIGANDIKDSQVLTLEDLTTKVVSLEQKVKYQQWAIIALAVYIILNKK